MTAPRRAAAHPTLLAVIIGGLVLAGAIALFTVLGGPNRSSGATDKHAARAAAAAPSSSTAASTTTSAPAKTTVPARSTAPAKASATTSTPALKSTPKSTPKSLPAPARRSVTYVVKKGDNLTIIAAWFHQHGYGDLYDRNRHTIGKNPNLIFPGQRITISDGTMSVGR